MKAGHIVEWVTTTTILHDLRDFRNVTAWDRLVGRFRPPIVAFAQDSGLPRPEAEDVAQETLAAFADAYRNGRYDPNKGRLNQWLFGIAYRQVLRERRRIARRAMSAAGGSDTAISGRIDDEEQASAVWDRQWELGVLEQCLVQVRQEVEPQTFCAFELVVRHERPPAQAARELGLSVKSVYNAKHRILKRIRELRDQYESAA